MAADVNRLCRVVEGLPKLPHPAQRSIRALLPGEPRVSDLAAIAAREPRLIALLHCAAAWDSPREGVALPEILERVGAEKALRLLLAACFRPLFSDPELHSVWNHQLQIAQLAEALAEVSGLENPRLAFFAGLVHDLGFLGLFPARGNMRQRYLQAFDEGWEKLRSEETFFGLSHACAGATIAREWSFPADVCAAVEYHHEPEHSGSKLAALVSLAHGFLDGGTGARGLEQVRWPDLEALRFKDPG